MTMPEPKSPKPTVDIIIEYREGIVLIQRKNPPKGWAIPGGFVDYNETLEAAALREAKEETNLKVENLRQFHTYSEPSRDPRQHTISTVFIAKATGDMLASSDAGRAAVFSESNLPEDIAFDHKIILKDYFCFKQGKELKW